MYNVTSFVPWYLYFSLFFYCIAFFFFFVLHKVSTSFYIFQNNLFYAFVLYSLNFCIINAKFVLKHHGSLSFVYSILCVCYTYFRIDIKTTLNLEKSSPW